MDPRDRADALLARASAQRHDVVTPDNATSPMDVSATTRLPRPTRRPAADAGIGEDQDTLSLPAPHARDEQGTQPLHRPAAGPAPAVVDEEPQTTSLDGLVPTESQQPTARKRSLADRLSGLD